MLQDTVRELPLFKVPRADNERATTSILELIPSKEYKPNDLKAVRSCLTNLFFALSIAEDALQAFIDNRYRSFDALIGNNSCYLTSYVIYLIARRFSSDYEAKIDLLESLKKIRINKQTILHAINHFERMGIRSLSNFFDQCGMELELDLEIIYLTMAYACTFAKHKNELEFEEIDYEKIIEIYDKKLAVKILRTSAVKLIKHWQKTLSQFNVKILQSHVNSKTDRLWAKYLSDEYILVDQRQRLCAPSLYSAAVIYNRLSQVSGAILGLQINLIEFPQKFISRFTLYYQVQGDTNLRILELEECLSTEPVYMFVGCRYVSDASKVEIHEIQQEFAKRELKNLILAHEVTYPQYPKSLKTENITPMEDDLLDEIAKFKNMNGFSLDDPTDLCLVHIFVDDILTQSLSMYEPPTFLPSFY